MFEATDCLLPFRVRSLRGEACVHQPTKSLPAATPDPTIQPTLFEFKSSRLWPEQIVTVSKTPTAPTPPHPRHPHPHLTRVRPHRLLLHRDDIVALGVRRRAGHRPRYVEPGHVLIRLSRQRPREGARHRGVVLGVRVFGKVERVPTVRLELGK